MTVTAFTSSVSGGRAVRGFTLIELAVVMFVIALLLGSIVLPLATGLESRKIAETQRILDQAREALIGYAAANGRFPCPALPNSTGVESFSTFPVGSAIDGRCNPLVGLVAGVYSGFLPAVTLGFTPVDANGYAVDAWGLAQNRIRYAVSNVSINSTANCTATPVIRPFTTASFMRTATMSCIAAATNLLNVCNTASAITTDCSSAAARLTRNVPVVIWSLGPNAATGGTSTDEIENLDNDPIFVSRIKAAAGEAGGEFDDIVTWIGASTLFSRLIAAGQLP